MKRRGEQPWQTNRARVLRAQPVSAQDVMWEALRNRRFKDLKFVRQAPIGPYFADFLCRSNKLVVEIDGATHGTETEIASDEVRTSYLEQNGYRVFRAKNTDVYDNLEGVLGSLYEVLSTLRLAETKKVKRVPSPPDPSSGGEG